MSAEDEWMIVDRHNRRGTGHSDVGENICSMYILAERVKGEVISRRRTVLVKSWSRAYLLAKFLLRSSVPCDTEAIDVEEAVAGRDLLL